MNKSTFLAIMMLLGVAVMIYCNMSAIRSGDVAYFSSVGLGVNEIVKGEADVITNAYTPLAALYFFIVYRSFPSQLFAETWAVFILFWLVGISLYGWRRLGDIDKWLFTASILVAAFLFHSTVVFGRYDILVGALLFLAWRSFHYARYGASAFFVVVAGGMKFVPVVFWPLLLLCTPKAGRKQLLLGTVAGVMMSIAIPALVMKESVVWQNLIYAVNFHEARGIQVESTWSGINMLWNALVGNKSVIKFHHYAFHNESLRKFTESLSRFLLLVGVSFVYVLAWVKNEKRKKGHFMVYYFVLALLILGVSPILSPQFFMWVVPSIVGWIIEKAVRSRVISREVLLVALTTITMGLITQWIYPHHYEPGFLSQSSTWLTLLLNARNGLVFVLAGVFLWQLRRRKTESGF